jgi:hypothetical protein
LPRASGRLYDKYIKQMESSVTSLNFKSSKWRMAPRVPTAFA